MLVWMVCTGMALRHHLDLPRNFLCINKTHWGSCTLAQDLTDLVTLQPQTMQKAGKE